MAENTEPRGGIGHGSNEIQKLQAQVQDLKGWIVRVLGLLSTLRTDGTDPVTDTQWESCINDGYELINDDPISG